jgi:hypothetical protein
MMIRVLESLLPDDLERKRFSYYPSIQMDPCRFLKFFLFGGFSQ